MFWTRRRALQSALGAGGALALGGLGWSRAARASAAPTVTDRYFVFAFFEGGWDTLLALDPRDPEVFTDDAVSETGIQPGYHNLEDDFPDGYLVETGLAGVTFGPYIGRLAQHVDRLAVLRGMAMSSIAHNPAKRHAITGRPPVGTSVRCSSTGTLLASLLGESELIPHLVGGVQTFNVGEPLWASGLSASSLSDLHSMLSMGDPTLPDAERDALERFFAEQRAGATSDALEAIYERRLAARDVVEAGVAELFDLDQLADLAERFRLDDVRESDTGAEFALMAYQALTNGISRCVSFEAASGLDAHSAGTWEDDHGPRQQDGFNAVADLATALAETPFGDGSSWLDHTTIVLASEFGRGATLNNAGGRGHSTVGACALLGAGIRGGQVIGASSDQGMAAQAVDLSTGAVSEGGEFVAFDHVARSLLESVGVTEDVNDFRVDPIPALLS